MTKNQHTAGWFYTEENEHKGPFTSEKMGELLASGAITSDTLICRAGMSEWVRLSSVSEFDFTKMDLWNSLPNVLRTPQPSQPPPKYSNHIESQHRTGAGSKLILTGIVCATIVLSIWIWKSSSHVTTVAAADGTLTQVDVGAIESVLTQDKITIANVQTVAEVVSNMRGIDTTHCPNDFREAYLAHIHAWEQMAYIEKQAIQLKAKNDSSGAYVEAFVRGVLGDPFGKANEERAAESELVRNAQDAQREIKMTFDRVEELAVRYGAALPQR